MAGPFVVRASDLLRRAGTERSIERTLTVAELGVDNECLDPQANVDVALHLESLTDGIVVDGSIAVPWRGTCRRCLQPAGGTETIEVHELYQPTLTDPDAFEIDGDLLDLAPMVTEAILLETPANPLCRPECAGLCPECGIDRNVSSCACQQAPSDNRWQALDSLRDVNGE